MNKIILVLFFTLLAFALPKPSFAQPIPKQVVQQIGTYLKSETGATFSFYLRRVNSTIEYENINDPYNTFGSSIIFVASAKGEGDMAPFGLVGIYRDGAVVWYSEPIAYPNHFTSGGISDVRELNEDGKAEIITTWTQHYDGIFGPKYGWVFSWDGSIGKRINEVGEDGYSTFISHETGNFSLTDLDGDGIWEIYSSTPETSIPIQSYKYHYYKWNGTIYEKLLTSPSEEELKFVPKDRLEAKILFGIERSDDHYSYYYQVFNQANSIQEIEQIYIKAEPKIITRGTKNGDWDFYSARRMESITWRTFGEIPSNIAPEDTSNVLAYSSVGIPSIRKYYLRGKNRSSLLSEISLEERITDIKTNSVSGHTLGPWLPDSSMSLQDFTDTLQTFRYRSCEELDWATDAEVCGELEDDLSEVKTSLQTGDSLSTANALAEFIDLVEQEKDASLTSEGYALLYFNAEYLAERLPEPQEPNTGSGITCGCDNPVTQSSGTITIENGDTRCLNTTFSGSVFFQSGGTLNVCSVATLQNVYGNQPGHIYVSETGEVTVGNWNNNFSEDAFTNWGTTTFSGWTTVNNGSLTNHGTLTVGGGLNQNNGALSNSGTLSVNRSVNINRDGVQNTGYWSIGQSLTLNSNAEVINECRVEVGNQLMINGVLESAPGSFVSAGGQLTINSGGRLSLGGNQAMATFNGVMLNGTIESTGASLMVTGNTFNFNSGAAITAGGEPLYLVAPNLSDVSASFNVADGSALVVPATACNPQGYNDPEN